MRGSLRISVFPDDSTDAQSLMQHAEAALHRAKINPLHEGVCFYSEDMETNSIARRVHYTQIKQAIVHHRVVTLYQPLVNALTGETIAVEAFAYFGLSGHLFRFHPARRFGVIRPA